MLKWVGGRVKHMDIRQSLNFHKNLGAVHSLILLVHDDELIIVCDAEQCGTVMLTHVIVRVLVRRRGRLASFSPSSVFGLY